MNFHAPNKSSFRSGRPELQAAGDKTVKRCAKNAHPFSETFRGISGLCCGLREKIRVFLSDPVILCHFCRTFCLSL